MSLTNPMPKVTTGLTLRLKTPSPDGLKNGLILGKKCHGMVGMRNSDLAGRGKDQSRIRGLVQNSLIMEVGSQAVLVKVVKMVPKDWGKVDVWLREANKTI